MTRRRMAAATLFVVSCLSFTHAYAIDVQLVDFIAGAFYEDEQLVDYFLSFDFEGSGISSIRVLKPGPMSGGIIGPRAS